MGLRLFLALVDCAAAVVVFVLASFVRFGDGDWLLFWGRIGIDIRIAAVLFGTLWIFVLWSQGLYAPRTRWPMHFEALRIARATVVVGAATLSALYIGGVSDVSRLFLVLLFVSTPVVALGTRRLARTAFGVIRQRGLGQRQMLVVGAGPLAHDFADLVEMRSHSGFRIAGHLALPFDVTHAVTRPILGGIEDFQRIIHTRAIDEIAVCVPMDQVECTETITEMAATEGKVVRTVIPQRRSRTRVFMDEEWEGFVVRSITADTGGELGFIMKRLVDIVGALVGLALLAPILVIVALLIRYFDGAPVLFRQTRVGLHGRLFTIYKFRTMVADAEDRFTEVAALSDTKGAAFKMINDPRVTNIGRFLRKSSIDELPQLLNVLRGEMSLVGPRPAPPREVDAYDIWHRRRLSMKPGITGLWQVEARFDEDFDSRAALDVTYIERWSPALDIKIMLRTLPAVLLHPGH